MTYDFQDILSPAADEKTALMEALIRDDLAYTDECGNTVLCPGTQRIMEENPNFIKSYIRKLKSNVQTVSDAAFGHQTFRQKNVMRNCIFSNCVFNGDIAIQNININASHNEHCQQVWGNADHPIFNQ